MENKWRRAEALEQDGLIDVRSHDLRAPLLGRCLVKHVVAHADLERKLHLGLTKMDSHDVNLRLITLEALAADVCFFFVFDVCGMTILVKWFASCLQWRQRPGGSQE